VRFVISTVVPNVSSPELLRLSASDGGTSVVTSTSNGAKSSATRCQIS
jgi:hypothetical protein